MKTIKTIDINAKEWFNKANGNSYFSATVTLNFAMDDEKSINIPIQYSYGDSFVYEAKKVLTEHNYISPVHTESPWQYCKKNNIILRTYKQKNCLKRELK